jgi:hypothetical protein
MHITAERAHVPVEFIGIARDLVRRLERADDAAVLAMGASAYPLIDRHRREHRTLRTENLADAARHWRLNMPPFGSLGRRIELGRKRLDISETRAAAATMTRKGWAHDEPGVSLIDHVLVAGPHDVAARVELHANISLHALARRCERDRQHTADDDLFADLRILAEAYPSLAAQPRGSEVKLAARRGSWIGETDDVRNQAGYTVRIACVRTFIEARE